MKAVLIEIKGIQQYEGQDSDKTTFTTVGTLEYKDGIYVLSYDESEMIGAKGVRSELSIYEDGTKMILARTGGMESRMTVEKGRRHNCLYNTPHGDFVIGIYGESIRVDIKSDGGSIYMSYNIDVNSGLLSKNILDIKVKEI